MYCTCRYFHTNIAALGLGLLSWGSHLISLIEKNIYIYIYYTYSNALLNALYTGHYTFSCIENLSDVHKLSPLYLQDIFQYSISVTNHIGRNKNHFMYYIEQKKSFYYVGMVL